MVGNSNILCRHLCRFTPRIMSNLIAWNGSPMKCLWSITMKLLNKSRPWSVDQFHHVRIAMFFIRVDSLLSCTTYLLRSYTQILMWHSGLIQEVPKIGKVRLCLSCLGQRSASTATVLTSKVSWMIIQYCLLIRKYRYVVAWAQFCQIALSMWTLGSVLATLCIWIIPWKGVLTTTQNATRPKLLQRLILLVQLRAIRLVLSPYCQGSWL